MPAWKHSLKTLATTTALGLSLGSLGCGGGGGGSSVVGPTPLPGISTQIDIALNPPVARMASKVFNIDVGLFPSLPSLGQSANTVEVESNGQTVTSQGGSLRLEGSSATLTIRSSGAVSTVHLKLPGVEGQRVRILLLPEGQIDLNQNNQLGDLIPRAFVIKDSNSDGVADDLFYHEILASGSWYTRSSQGLVWMDMDADGQYTPSKGDVMMCDQDNDGLSDETDLDDDNDSVNDTSDTDDDNDGIADATDTQDTDNDNDEIGNFLDPDFRDPLLPQASVGGLAQAKNLIQQDFLFRSNIPANLDAFQNPWQLMAALGDPYSGFSGVAEKAAANTPLTGIGVVLTRRQGRAGAYISGLVAGGPSARAGLLVGDILVAAGGVDLSLATIQESAFQLRGAEGTKLLLTVDRGAERLRYILTREQLGGAAMVSSTVEAPGIVRVLLTSFGTGAAQQVAAALAAQQNLTGVMLDLRDNRGGFVSEAMRLSDLFLTQGTIYSFQDAQGQVQPTVAQNQGTEITVPLVILVNENTASAAEIVAAAMLENNRAHVVGLTTFGKGIAQTTYSLTSGEEIKITTDYWLSPQSHNLHGLGVTPDRPVPEGDDVIAPALQALANP